nr:hypothetical protein [Jiangella ureilytica]
MVGDLQLGHGGGQLAGAVRAEGVVVLGPEVGQLRLDDLAQLAPSAGDERDVGALGGVAGHGGAGADGLVVGVGVNQQQAALGKLDGHALHPMHALRQPADHRGSAVGPARDALR